MSVPEAPLRTTKFGLAPDGEGWFVLNAKDSRWRDDGTSLGFYTDFEGKRRFPQLGVSLYVLHRGEAMSMYHRERHQEAFLVLAGECLLIVEGEERTLRAWDFFHCPGETAHTIVGAGDGPAVVFACGARGGARGYFYPTDPAAAAHGAAADRDTTEPADAYARFPASTRCRFREEWFDRHDA